MSTGIVCAVCLLLHSLSCSVSPMLAPSCCGQAVHASSLIDNSQQGPSQGAGLTLCLQTPLGGCRPWSRPSTIANSTDTTKHWQLFTNNAAFHFLTEKHLGMYAYTCRCCTNSHTLLSFVLKCEHIYQVLKPTHFL